jgi:predicted NUDIX family NTP pyrophosphohydrolase
MPSPQHASGGDVCGLARNLGRGAALASATFSIEWPPGSGRRAAFPEVDRAEWFPLSTARRRLSAGQVPLLDQLACLVAAGEDSVHDRLDGADPGGT